MHKSHIMAPLLLFGLALTLTGCWQGRSSCDWQRECFSRVAESLDSASTYKASRERVLSDYRASAAAAKSDDEAFVLYLKIAECYVESDTKQALAYQERCMAIAKRQGSRDKLARSMIMRCEILNRAGYLDRARHALDSLSRLPLTPSERVEYYSCEVQYWSNNSIFYNIEQPCAQSVAYADSILQSGAQLSAAMRLHARVWGTTDKAEKRQLLADMQQHIATLKPDDPNYKQLTMEAAILGAYQGDSHTLLTMATVSLEHSLRDCDKRVPMLWYVAIEAMHTGELDYAQRFIDVCVDCNRQFPDHLNTPLYGTLHELSSAMQQREQHNLRVVTTLAIIALVLLIVAVVGTVQSHRLAARRRQLLVQLQEQYALVKQVQSELEQEQQRLRDANATLAAQTAELRESQLRLSEANYLKEEYIGRMFAMCTDYLRTIDDLKKDINRKLKVGQVREALEATRADSTDSQRAMHGLLDRFDEIFLGLFPNFTEQFNELLRPDERVQLRDPKHLNTDLRIVALVRLGIDNSMLISQILGLSPQTVYNARQKLRARALPAPTPLADRIKSLAIGTVTPEP